MDMTNPAGHTRGMAAEHSITISIPADVLSSLHLPPGAEEDEIRMLAAMKLYELERLSSGAAARLAGIPRTVFLSRLADYGVDTFRLTAEELDAETPIA